MNKKLLIGILISFTAAALILAGIFHNLKQPAYEPQQNLNAPIEIPDTGIVALNELADDSKPALVMFYVDWCGYCKRYMPIFGEISKKYSDKYNFAVVNCDYPENRDWVQKANIIGFPTLKIIDKKYNVILSIDMGATQDNDVLFRELNQYLSLRNRIQ